MNDDTLFRRFLQYLDYASWLWDTHRLIAPWRAFEQGGVAAMVAAGLPLEVEE